MQTG
jgi:hypothetical protein